MRKKPRVELVRGDCRKRLAEDFRILGIEQDAGYLRIARRRLARATLTV